MKNLTINIDDDLWLQIEGRTTPDFDHGDVALKLLRRALASSPPASPIKPIPPPTPASKDSIVSFVQTSQYRILNAIDKYLAVLSWVHKNMPTEFEEKLLNFRRGNRLYFGRSQQQVEESGEGINAKQIPGSNIWALATLDNRAKRTILDDVLHLFNFPPGETNVVVDSVPDSGRHRGYSADEIDSLLK